LFPKKAENNYFLLWYYYFLLWYFLQRISFTVW
jgi:hypothetical protein